MRDFSPTNHYWRVGGEASRVWSSAKFAYVPATDPGYEAWAAESDTTTPIASEADLTAALRPFGLSMTGAIRSAPGPALVHVLDKTTKVSSRDLAYVASLSTARDNMASIIRIADVDGRKVSDWFDAALAD